MKYFEKDDSIDQLELSVRARNLLGRNKITTIGALVNVPQEAFLSWRNCGAKTLAELIEIANDICVINGNIVGDPATELLTPKHTQTTFMGTDGHVYVDIPLADLGLSARSYHCLSRNGIAFASELSHTTNEELYSFPHLGVKSVAEIVACREALVFRPAVEQVAPPAFHSASQTKPTVSLAATVAQKIAKKIPCQTKSVFTLVLDVLEEQETWNSDDLFVSDQNESFLTHLYEMEPVITAIKEAFLKSISKNIYGLDESALLSMLPAFMRSEAHFEKIINDLSSIDGAIVNRDGRWVQMTPTVEEYLAFLPQVQSHIILRRRLYGETLESIGQELGLTRERVRQIIAKKLRQMPYLFEDRYREIFQKYCFDKESFLLGFRESEAVYYYLSLRYKNGELPMEQLATDDTVPEFYRKAAERIIYREYVQLGGEYVCKSRSDLTEYIIRTAGKDGLTFDEFTVLYQELIITLGLDRDEKFSVMGRGYENKISNDRHYLWKYKKRFRYYNIEAYDFTHFFEVLNFDQYHNVEYSTRKWFLSYPELMMEYDLLDEYELHNLLKKICAPEDYPNVHIRRMPNVEFGQASRDKQVQELLILYAPIDNLSFANVYEQEYGVLPQTAMANFFKCIDQFYHQGIYTIDSLEMPPEIFDRMHILLENDFYLLSDVKQIYSSTFPEASEALLNPRTLKQLGFMIYSGYMIKSTYPSAAAYSKTLLTSKDLISLDELPRGLTTQISFTSELYKLRAEYELIEYATGKYINFRRLKNAGLSKEDITSYKQAVRQFVTNPYFTVYSIRKQGFSHALDDLGFEETFYSSILAEIRDWTRYIRIGKNRLFLCGTIPPKFSDYVEWLVYSNDTLSYDLWDLTDHLANQYNIQLDSGKIVELIKGTDLYYNRITKKIYADYDIYFDSI